MIRRFAVSLVAVVALAVFIAAHFQVSPVAANNCQNLPSAAQIKAALVAAAAPTIGGLFNGERMWGAVVNRDGQFCAEATSTGDKTQVWPGSQAIAKAKAYTANAFSLDTLALSTAMLYTFTQPGHSLWSLGQSNLFNPAFLTATSDTGTGVGQIAGGLIFFGGGVALYHNNKIVGGLGVSGDTSCADHEVAKSSRTTLALDPPGGPAIDDIVYPSDGPSVFMHPACLNTFRNGVAVVGGTETPATTY
jgi:uncharacterized protein GlcG (DUF336 family)